jgi:hypothetical protein
MTKEEECVVNPLRNFLRKRSRAKWTIIKQSKGRSEKGWDLQVKRKNQVLIEAKYIRGPFATILAGLTAAPLSNRPQKMKTKKYRSWDARICWAIGSGRKSDKHDMSRVYQNLFDYFARNLKFWKCYSKTLKVKYVFFVADGKVAKISFIKMVNLAGRYKKSSLPKSPSQKDIAAEEIVGKLIFK